MKTLLNKLKPAVGKGWLYGTAGLMWSAVGMYLTILAYGWLKPLAWTSALPFAIGGVVLAFAIYTFGFSKLAKKNIDRIHGMAQEKNCLFAFQQWHSYPLVAFMIMLGITLRTHAPISKPYLAVLYIGIGGGLFFSSLYYYKKILGYA